jgi:hypothetical protein
MDQAVDGVDQQRDADEQEQRRAEHDADEPRDGANQHLFRRRRHFS